MCQVVPAVVRPLSSDCLRGKHMAVSPAVIIICLPCSYLTISQTPTDWSVYLTEEPELHFEIAWVPFVKK